ncbi:rRNA-processing protein UTP23 [Tanacetum coccineum]
MQGLMPANFPQPFLTLCDHPFVTNVLGQPSQEIVLKNVKKVLGGDFTLAVTPCTAWSLVKANGILPHGFSAELCDHDTPVSDSDCVVERLLNVDACKIVLATSSEEVMNKMLYSPQFPILLYAKTRNNMRLIGLAEDEETSTDEEETQDPVIMGGRKRKVDAKRSKSKWKRIHRDRKGHASMKHY